MPTRDELDRILKTRTGDLGETPYGHLLLALAVREQTATLELRRTPLEKSIVFDAGSPVECRSNIATETLGRFLVAQGKITDDDARNALSAAAARGVPLGEVLVERKLLSSSDLYRHLQQNLGRKLLEPFSWTSGTWEISFDAPRAGSALRVRTPQLLVTGVVKVLPQELADAFAAFTTKYVSLSPRPFFALDEVRWSAEQQKVIDAARSGTTFDELRERSGIEADELHRILYALDLLGITTLSDERQAEVAVPVFFEDIELETPSPAPPASAPALEPQLQNFELPAPPPPPTRAASAEEVLGQWLSWRRKDAFDLLGVEESAEPPALIAAYVDLAEKFAPWSFENDTPERLRDKAQEVYLALARAYAEVADGERRNAVVARRALLREEAAKAAERSRSALLDPEEMLKSGRALFAAGKLREALGNFEMAAQCDAQNGTYAAEAAWTRFRLNATPATNALKVLRNAIRIDPKAGVAYLYIAQILGILGQKVEASGYLGRAENLLPGDKRLAEAAKALR